MVRRSRRLRMEVGDRSSQKDYDATHLAIPSISAGLTSRLLWGAFC